jgi:hypothetical protein
MTSDRWPLFIILVPLLACIVDFLLSRTYHRALSESLSPERPALDTVLLALVPLGAMLVILLTLGECG